MVRTYTERLLELKKTGFSSEVSRKIIAGEFTEEKAKRCLDLSDEYQDIFDGFEYETENLGDGCHTMLLIRVDGTPQTDILEFMIENEITVEDMNIMLLML